MEVRTLPTEFPRVLPARYSASALAFPVEALRNAQNDICRLVGLKFLVIPRAGPYPRVIDFDPDERELALQLCKDHYLGKQNS